jgi:hypothetical protein
MLIKHRITRHKPSESNYVNTINDAYKCDSGMMHNTLPPHTNARWWLSRKVSDKLYALSIELLLNEGELAGSLLLHKYNLRHYLQGSLYVD